MKTIMIEAVCGHLTVYNEMDSVAAVVGIWDVNACHICDNETALPQPCDLQRLEWQKQAKPL